MKGIKKEIMVELGIKGRKEAVVTLANVATSVGSGTVKVFSTPSMIQLMETLLLVVRSSNIYGVIIIRDKVSSIKSFLYWQTKHLSTKEIHELSPLYC